MTEFYTTEQLAKILNAPEATLRYWRHIGTGPPSFKFGRRVRYPRDQYEKWLEMVSNDCR